jgi:hypothetical protein
LSFTRCKMRGGRSTQYEQKHIGLDAMTHSWRVPGPVALRPTWKGNLFWLLVILVVVLAVAS